MEIKNKKKYVIIVMAIGMLFYIGYFLLNDFFEKKDLRQNELLQEKKDVERIRWEKKRLEQEIQETPRDPELLEKIILDKHGNKKLNEDTVGFKDEEKLD